MKWFSNIHCVSFVESTLIILLFVILLSLTGFSWAVFEDFQYRAIVFYTFDELYVTVHSTAVLFIIIIIVVTRQPSIYFR